MSIDAQGEQADGLIVLLDHLDQCGQSTTFFIGLGGGRCDERVEGILTGSTASWLILAHEVLNSVKNLGVWAIFWCIFIQQRQDRAESEAK